MEDIYSSSGGPEKPRNPNRRPAPSPEDGGRDIYSGRQDDFDPINTYNSEDFYPYDDFTTPPPELKRRGSNAVKPDTPRSPRAVQPGSTQPGMRQQQRPASMTRYAQAEEDVYSNKGKKSQQPAGQAAPAKKKKKKSCCFKLAMAMIALFLAGVIALGAIGIYVYNLLGDIDFNLDGAVENPYIDESELADSSKVTNILLIGVDAREEDTKSRSDTMMMVSIDRHNKRIKLTSFLRDTWVDYPDGTDGRLNGASFEDGPQYTIDMIEYTYHIRCDYYIMVDFNVFRTVVDQIGGIDVEVTEKEADYMGSGKRYAPNPPIEMEAGTVHMDGNAALWYSRIRYLDSDYMRTERQRKVVSAIIAKLKDMNPVEMLNLVKKILPEVETNMNEGQIIRFGLKSLGCFDNSVLQQQIPAEGEFENRTIRGNAVLVPDLNANRSILKDFLYGTDPQDGGAGKTE